MSKKKKIIIISIILTVVLAVSVGLSLFFVLKPKNNQTPPQEPPPELPPAVHTHTLTDWQTVKEPTCTDAGVQERHCTGCNFSEQQQIAAKGHTEVSEYNYVRHLVYCSVCGTEFESGVHVFDDEYSCSACGFAVEPTIDLTFTDIDDDTCYLSGIDEMSIYETTLIIPATVEDKTVVKVDFSSLDRTANAEKIAGIEILVIPDTVKEISAGAFQSFTALEQAYLSVNLTEIPANAFSHCSNLRDFNVPEQLSKIGASAFEECENIKTMPLPNDVQGFEIEDRAFYDCSRLSTIDIPDSLTKIGASAFEGCANLNSITLPAGLTDGENIGNNCFKSTNIYEIVNLTDIGFTVNNIKPLFDGTRVPEKLTIITDKADSQISTTEDGFRFYEYENEKYLINYVGSRALVTLPTLENQTYTVASMCFYLNDDIEYVTISGSAKTVQDFAFYSCTNLTSIVIRNGVETIGQNAFQCGSISEFYVEYDSEEDIPAGWTAGWNRELDVYYNDGTWVLDADGMPVPAEN